MVEDNEQLILKELQKIPGVGPKISKYFLNIGIKSIEDLRNKNPEQYYDQLCEHLGFKVDRCMLYVFRCAIYYASNNEYDVELLKWWNWKEKMW